MLSTRFNLRMRLVLVVTLSFGLAGCSVTPQAEPGWTLVIDTAELGPAALPSLSPNEETRLLRGLFGDRYDSFQAAVTAFAEGAFLAPDRTSSAIIAQYPGPAMLGLQDRRLVLAVFDDGHVARFPLDPEDGQFLVALIDLGDGHDRLVLRRDQMHMGEKTVSLSILDLVGGNLERLAHFPLAWHDSCAAPLAQNESILAARIKMRVVADALAPSAQLTLFRADSYEVPCPTGH